MSDYFDQSAEDILTEVERAVAKSTGHESPLTDNKLLAEKIEQLKAESEEQRKLFETAHGRKETYQERQTREQALQDTIAVWTNQFTVLFQPHAITLDETFVEKMKTGF